ncbi:MAG: methyltransferase domain-containing protein [Pseudomonadota bacterium]
MSDAMIVFDRALVRARRTRAVASLGQADFLFREAAERLVERLEDITRVFPMALDIGCHDGAVGRALGGRGGVETLVQCDFSPAMAAAAGGLALAADEESQPFAPGAFDLVLSALSLHWVNDLPGALLQLSRALKPDGLLLASMLGGETLIELRQALIAAESELEGGAGPRVSPFADVRDLGGLLQRAGFALPVVDADTLTVSYPDPFALMADLRAMGETSALLERRRRPSRRTTFLRAAELYQDHHGGPDGRVPATFQILTMTAWAPHASQQQPLRPGSAKARLAQALGGEEVSAGEKAGRD